MFNRGITELLQELPAFEGLDGTSVKRLLTRAYLEGLDLVTVAGDAGGSAAAELRRMATALEIHAVLSPEVNEHSRRAAAFVAAESLNLLSGIGAVDLDEEHFPAFGSRERYRRVEAGLLYLIAAFDANAAIAVRGIESVAAPTAHEEDSEEARAADWALERILALIRMSSPRQAEFPIEGQVAPVDAAPGDASSTLVPDVRIAVWRRLGSISNRHLEWLRLEAEGSDSDAVADLVELGALLEHETATPFADLAHLARLLRFACDGTSARALRGVEPPPEDPAIFNAYLARRCRDKPLLWPSAERYRDECLPGPASHAAVAMPTGSGKSAVAELAVAQALAKGWVVYLAPTRAP